MEITRGKIPKAKKTAIYGPEGIGTTTICSKFPDPLFIDTEEGSKELDVARLPIPSSWEMILEEVRYVRDHPDICKTLVIDTADKAQQLAINEMCAEHQCKSVEDPGYGKGYVYTYEKFGKLLNLLDEIVERGIHVVITAHAAMRKFEQPDEPGAYDRWEMKLVSTKNCNVSAMLREWCDMVLFVNYKTHTVAEDKDGKKKKALGTGKRVMYTSHHSCWDAKNRYGLPDEIPFEYEAIAHIFAENVHLSAENAQKPQKVTAESKKMSKIEKSVSAEGKTSPSPDEEVPDKSKEEPEKKEAADEPDPPTDSSKSIELDPRIPKALRDLMIANKILPFEIQAVVAKRGYYPKDVDIWDYDQEFIDGCLVGAWDQVYAMMDKQSQTTADNPFVIPFDEEKEMK